MPGPEDALWPAEGSEDAGSQCGLQGGNESCRMSSRGKDMSGENGVSKERAVGERAGRIYIMRAGVV